MKKRDEYLLQLRDGRLNEELGILYPGNEEAAGRRYIALLEKLPQNSETYIFSSPGRTELGGNHTDHNNGCVLAASVDLDTVAAVQKRNDSKVVIESKRYPGLFEVDLEDLEKHSDEEGNTNSLIRGVASGFSQRGYSAGGFCAYIDSTVPGGSGLSSSASIEVLIGDIFNQLYNGGDVDRIELSKIGQYAENSYFGKPSGLMDQIACSHGGIVHIDFIDPSEPVVTRIMNQIRGFALFIINTGGSHADLTEDYASVPEEMFEAAKLLGKKRCREISAKMLLDNIGMIRKELGDRHVLRALHFIEENHRVDEMTTALKMNDLARYVRLVNESGDSSFKYLQNCYSPGNFNEQGIPVALGLTEKVLKGCEYACRVHGGGFAGTIQAYVPETEKSRYVDCINSVFGEGSAMEIHIRSRGLFCFK